MPSEPLAAAVVNLLTTYLLHSTLLLGSVAVAVWCYAPRSHAFREWLWKSAAVIPLVSASLQLAAGVGNPVFCSLWVTSAMERPIAAEPVTNRETAGAEESGLRIDEIRVGPVEDVAEPGEETAAVSVPVLPSTTMKSIPVGRDTTVVAEPAPVFIPEQGEVSQPVRDSVAVVPAAERVSVAAPVSREAEAPWGYRLITWGAWLVVCVFAAGLLRVMVTSWLFHRRIRWFRVVIDGPVHGELSRLVKREPSRRHVRLLESDELEEPISLGVWRPTIVVPRDIAERLTGEEIEALLAHELAHLVRGDTRWLVIGRLLRCCLPFQPLNLLACRKWRQAAEFQCDEWAAEQTGNPLALARCLTNIAEWRIDVALSPHALPASGTKSTISLRIERLLSENRVTDRWNRAAWRRALVVAALVVTAGLCCLGPRSSLMAQFESPHEEARQHPVEPEIVIANSLDQELQLLNEEVQQLESELRRVDALIDESNTNEEVGMIVKQLSVRLADLRRHRRELLSRAVVPANVIDVIARKPKSAEKSTKTD